MSITTFKCEAELKASHNFFHQIFKQTSEDIKSKNIHPLSINPSIKEFFLYDILLARYLDKNIETIKAADIERYKREYPKSIWIEKVKSKWLDYQFTSKNFKTFNSMVDKLSKKDDNYYCHKILSGANSSTYNMENKIDLNKKICQDCFTKMYKEKKISNEKIVEIIKSNFEKKNYHIIKNLKKLLPKKKYEEFKIWENSISNPEKILEDFISLKNPSKKYLDAIVYCVTRISEDNPEKAIKYWNKISKLISTDSRQWFNVTREIGLGYAYQMNIAGVKWLEKIPSKYMSDKANDWKMRLAVKHGLWKKVISYYQQLDNKRKEESMWKYWFAKSKYMTNSKEEANKIFKEVTINRDYYGLLASIFINETFVLKKIVNQDIVTQEVIDNFIKKNSLERIKHLTILNETEEAFLEWKLFIKNANQKERAYAIQLCSMWKLPVNFMLSIANIKGEISINKETHEKFAKEIINNAKLQGIDPAWVFAVTKAESAFISNATSKSGARGLMQIKPDTAEDVAKSLSLSLNNHKTLHNPSINIKLGCKYLREMLDKNNAHYVLATAAYNAGPNRIKKWHAIKGTPADVWVETIPYWETRNYVKKVIIYTALFQELLKKDLQMDKYLRPIN